MRRRNIPIQAIDYCHYCRRFTGCLLYRCCFKYRRRCGVCRVGRELRCFVGAIDASGVEDDGRRFAAVKCDGQVEGDARVGAVEGGLDEVAVDFEDREVELIVVDVVEDEVGLDGEHLVDVLVEVANAVVGRRLARRGHKSLGQAHIRVGAVVELHVREEHVLGRVGEHELAHLLLVVGLFVRRQIDVVAAEGERRRDRHAERRARHRRVHVLGAAPDDAQALALPVVQRLVARHLKTC